MPPTYTVAIDWSKPLRTGVTTAATVEVDVMPHLSRVDEGGSFPGYYSALSNLGARYVRFSPWFPYPKVNVAELEKADCAAHGSSWNTALLDGIISDFMHAVCGPFAASGVCDNGLSVVPQLSTIPTWMFEPDGHNRTLPADPWHFPSNKFDNYLVKGKPLLDPYMPRDGTLCGAVRLMVHTGRHDRRMRQAARLESTLQVGVPLRAQRG